MISTVGIVTRNRVASLVACVESYLEKCRRHGRNPEFVVTDDSLDTEAQDHARGALQSLGNHFGAQIRYAGRREKNRFAEALARESAVPPKIIRFALFGDDRCALTTGANRNSLLLDTVDTFVLSVDDDTRCRIAAAPDAEDAVAFFSGYDPTEFWYFADRASADASIYFVDVDALRCHEALLGNAVANVDDPAANGRVAITLHGLVGDPGMNSPRYYLGMSGPSRERLVASPDAYRSAFRSREVLRTVRRPTVSAGPFCMTTFFGFDNRLALPPFFPVQRNADGIFGLVLQKCVEGSHVAFLPSFLQFFCIDQSTRGRSQLMTSGRTREVCGWPTSSSPRFSRMTRGVPRARMRRGWSSSASICAGSGRKPRARMPTCMFPVIWLHIVRPETR